jgi:hypothetical protein
MADKCPSRIGAFTAAWEVVPGQFEYFTNIANDYIRAANEFTQQLSNYTIEPLQFEDSNFAAGATYTPFERPADPEDFESPDNAFTGALPVAPDIGDIDTGDLDTIKADFGSAPTSPVIQIPPPPIVNLPSAPTEPAIDIPAVPDAPTLVLPEVPTLRELDLPDAPDINLDDLDVERPDFIDPSPLSDAYIGELREFFARDYEDFYVKANEQGAPAFRTLLQNLLLAGGQSLPCDVERQLFNQAISDVDRNSAQAVAQAENEWAGRGFDLPGSTMLARVQEAREENRRQRGAAQRNLHIQFHQQQLESLRWGVERGIQLEGQLASVYAQIYELSKSYTDFHWNVVKDIYDSQVELIRLRFDIYKADIEAYKVGLEAELAKVEVFKGQLEAQRLIGQINQQDVEIYNTQLRGVLAEVEVFKATVDAVEAQIRGEVAKVDLFRGQIQAYTAQIEGERTKFQIYDSQIGAEEVKARIYSAQVDGYAKRIDAYQAEINAEVSKVNAQTGIATARSNIYSNEVEAWAAGVQADTANLQAFVEVYRANLQKYTALLNAEQYRVQGESRNTELAVEEEKARVSALLKQADQAIEQLKHVTSLGLSATETAARVNSQLAASAMSAINVSAGVSSSNSVNATDSRSCSTRYSGSVV